MNEVLIFEVLKAKQRALRDGFSPNLSLRVHRALSWLNRAEMAGEDMDASFIFLWIAFNAAYAEERVDAARDGERRAFEEYFGKIIALDAAHRVYHAIWTRFSGPIRLLLDNKYVFQPFWSHHNGTPGYEDWEHRFARSRHRLQSALANHDTRTVLTTLFDRMYVLRNQLVHGGATWNSGVNRAQVTDAAAIMGVLLPLFLDIMMDNPNEAWGQRIILWWSDDRTKLLLSEPTKKRFGRLFPRIKCRRYCSSNL